VERWDVVVVGGGPAGCAAAASVRWSWPAARILVLDRAAFPRDKACGDGIAFEATEALDRLGFCVPDLVRGYPPLRRLELHAPGGPVVARPMRREVYVVPRLVFDARLVEQLGRFGVEVRRHNVRALRISANGVEVDGRIRADVVIGADGANSVVRRVLQPRQRRPRQVALALRGYGPELPGQDGVQLIAMSGRRWPAYGWSFPLGDGRANIGYGEHLGVMPLTRAAMWRRMAELLPGATTALASVRGHHLPLSAGRPHIPDGPVLLAGDAQSLVNPITGEGIFYAVVSGALAGRAATDPNPGGAYRRLLQRRLSGHFRHTSTLARFGRWPGLIDAGVRAAAADQRVFDDLVDLGLADGRLTARTVARVRWRDRPA
jgi:geranylgeranyl reductase family protein